MSYLLASATGRLRVRRRESTTYRLARSRGGRGSPSGGERSKSRYIHGTYDQEGEDRLTVDRECDQERHAGRVLSVRCGHRGAMEVRDHLHDRKTQPEVHAAGSVMRA